jgi:fructose-bisphosphate aldolase class 1
METDMATPEQIQQMQSGAGFIAALDQSGGSTPKALKLYGVEENAYGSDEEMFDLIHEMRARIASAPDFTGKKVIGAILFEKTMDRDIAGQPSAAGCAVSEDRQRVGGGRRRGADAEGHAGVGCHPRARL